MTQDVKELTTQLDQLNEEEANRPKHNAMEILKQHADEYEALDAKYRQEPERGSRIAKAKSYLGSRQMNARS